MVPLVVMVVAWIVFRILDVAAGVTIVDSWTEALRFALATMFVSTAASHFKPAEPRERSLPKAEPREVTAPS